VLATVAAWYFLLRSPAPRPTPEPAPPTTVAAAATPTTLPPPTTLAAAPTPSAAVTVAPTPAAVAPPSTTLAAAPSPTPRATPQPTPLPEPAAAAQPSGEAQRLLRQGAFAESARAFAATLAPGARGRFSHQLLTACAPETIAKAVQAVSSEELFILPVTFQGRACYRLCWGVYDGRPAAEAGRAGVPAYFRQAGATPRLSPLAELLP
jgi:hypothetical protein